LAHLGGEARDAPSAVPLAPQMPPAHHAHSVDHGAAREQAGRGAGVRTMAGRPVLWMWWL
jgi:hypothetical protein